MTDLSEVSGDQSTEDWEAAARRDNVPQEAINDWKLKAKGAPRNVAEAVNDPANQQTATEYATKATWYTLLGTLLSMAAAIGGALVGAGPSFRLLGMRVGIGRPGYENQHYANRP